MSPEPQPPEDLTRIIERLGASPAQAGVIARQLWKRSAQLARERQIKQVEALDYLLRLTISGRQGEAPLQAPQDGQSGDAAD